MPGPFAPAFTGTTAFSPPVAEKSALEGLSTTANNVFSNISTIGKNYLSAQAANKPSYTQIKDEREQAARFDLSNSLDQAKQLRAAGNSAAADKIERKAIVQWNTLGFDSSDSQTQSLITSVTGRPADGVGMSAAEEQTYNAMKDPSYRIYLGNFTAKNPGASTEEAEEYAVGKVVNMAAMEQSLKDVKVTNEVETEAYIEKAASLAGAKMMTAVETLQNTLLTGGAVAEGDLTRLVTLINVQEAEIEANIPNATEEQKARATRFQRFGKSLVNIYQKLPEESRKELLATVHKTLETNGSLGPLTLLGFYTPKVLEAVLTGVTANNLGTVAQILADGAKGGTSLFPEGKAGGNNAAGDNSASNNSLTAGDLSKGAKEINKLNPTTFRDWSAGARGLYRGIDRLRNTELPSDLLLNDTFSQVNIESIREVYKLNPTEALDLIDMSASVLERTKTQGIAYLHSLGQQDKGIITFAGGKVTIDPNVLAEVVLKVYPMPNQIGTTGSSENAVLDWQKRAVNEIKESLASRGGDVAAFLNQKATADTPQAVLAFLRSPTATSLKLRSKEISAAAASVRTAARLTTRYSNFRKDLDSSPYDDADFGDNLTFDASSMTWTPASTGVFTEDAKAQIKAHEGLRLEAYPDGDGFAVGYGHNGVPEGTKITQQQADAYFEKDFSQKLAAARKAIPKFDELTDELKIEIVQGFFRGDLSGSPKTLALINQGKFAEASKEFLNNREYRSPDTMQGVKRRMERISDALAYEAGVPLSRPKDTSVPPEDTSVPPENTISNLLVSPANADTVRTDTAQGRLEDQVAQAVTDNPEQFNLENLGTPTGDTPVPQARQGGFDTTPVPQPRPGFNSQGNEVFDGTTGSTPIPRDNLGDISSGSEAGSIVVPPKKKGGTSVTIETTGERKSILESFLPNVSANQYQFVSDLVSNQLGLDPVQKSEDFFSAVEIRALKDAVVASRGKSRTKGKIAYANYKTHTDGVWYSEKIGSFDDENLAADYSVKTVLGRANWYVDERGHVIVVDKYDFADAAKFQKKFKTPFAKLEHLVDVYRNMDNMKLGSYGLLKTIAHLYGSTEDKPSDTFRIDLGPLEDMGQ